MRAEQGKCVACERVDAGGNVYVVTEKERGCLTSETDEGIYGCVFRCSRALDRGRERERVVK